MSLKLYYDPVSSPCRAVLALLHLAKIPYEKVIVSVFKGETKNPDYQKINPLGKVPALDDNGYIVFEHEAILRYLVNTHKEAQAYFPTDIKTQALIDQYYPFHHYSIRRYTIQYFAGLNGMIPNFDKEAGLKEVEAAVSKLDSVFLQDKKYLTGDKITIADFSAVSEISQLYYATDFDFNKFPRVKAYIERYFDNQVIKEANQGLLDFAEKVAGNGKK